MSHPDSPLPASAQDYLNNLRADNAARLQAQAQAVDSLLGLVKVATLYSGEPALVRQLTDALVDIMPQPLPLPTEVAASLAFLGVTVTDTAHLLADPKTTDNLNNTHINQRKVPGERTPKPYITKPIEELMQQQNTDWVLLGEIRYISLARVAESFDGSSQDYAKRFARVKNQFKKWSNRHSNEVLNRRSPTGRGKGILYADETVSKFLEHMKASETPRTPYKLVRIKKN
jgi:hypothetical protein